MIDDRLGSIRLQEGLVMRIKRLVARFAIAAVVVGAIATGLASFAVPAQAASASACRCPLIYAPVACDHGKTYPNQCEADCHHAKNCVPTGAF
jgi:hypothetical protein